MTDESSLPVSDQASLGADLPPARSDRSDKLPWIYGLGFVVLAAAIIYLWQNPPLPPAQPSNAAALHAVEQQLASIDSRLTRLEQLPQPTAQHDLTKINGQLEARAADEAQLASRMDVLSGRIESLSGRDQSGLDATRQQLDKAVARLGAIEKSGGNLDVVATRMDQIIRLQAAALALADGQPLGDLPGAPPALSKYAHASPPTLARLRLAFPELERGILSGEQPIAGNGPFIDRVWEHAQSLVTVRQGDDVVVGSASAVALTRARLAIEAGDLAASVAAMRQLGPNALRAATGWLNDAQALLDARSTLANMAAHI